MIARNLTAGRQWRSNPLGVAACAVFVAGTLRSVAYFVHALPLPNDDPVVHEATRAVLGSPLAAAWAIVASAVLLLYLLPRARRDVLDVSSLVAWEMKRMQRDALRLQQDVQARLAFASDALAQDDVEACRGHLDEALAAARSIVTEMLPASGRMTGRLRSSGGRHD